MKRKDARRSKRKPTTTTPSASDLIRRHLGPDRAAPDASASTAPWVPIGRKRCLARIAVSLCLDCEPVSDVRSGVSLARIRSQAGQLRPDSRLARRAARLARSGDPALVSQPGTGRHRVQSRPNRRQGPRADHCGRRVGSQPDGWMSTRSRGDVHLHRLTDAGTRPLCRGRLPPEPHKSAGLSDARPTMRRVAAFTEKDCHHRGRREHRILRDTSAVGDDDIASSRSPLGLRNNTPSDSLARYDLAIDGTRIGRKRSSRGKPNRPRRISCGMYGTPHRSPSNLDASTERAFLALNRESFLVVTGWSRGIASL